MEKTHVLLQDVTISELGRCQAGDPIAETDTHPTTWAWLGQNRMLKSIAEIQQEADAEDEPDRSSEPDPATSVVSPVNTRPSVKNPKK